MACLIENNKNNTLPKTSSPHLKIGAPEKETSLPIIHFLGAKNVSFREGYHFSEIVDG